MKAKLIEVRDAATYLPVIAVKLEPANEAERYMLRRAGFSAREDYVLYVPLHMAYMPTADPNTWSDRTNSNAHKLIALMFDQLEPGDLLDIEYELGEKPTKKIPERLEYV